MPAGADTTARAATTATPAATPASPRAGVDAPDSTPAPDPAPTIVWVAWGLCGVFAAIGFVVVTGPALFAVVLGWLRFAD
jgi:hypothetical protein